MKNKKVIFGIVAVLVVLVVCCFLILPNRYTNLTEDTLGSLSNKDIGKKVKVTVMLGTVENIYNDHYAMASNEALSKNPFSSHHGEEEFIDKEDYIPDFIRNPLVEDMDAKYKKKYQNYKNLYINKTFIGGFEVVSGIGRETTTDCLIIEDENIGKKYIADKYTENKFALLKKLHENESRSSSIDDYEICGTFIGNISTDVILNTLPNGGNIYELNDKEVEYLKNKGTKKEIPMIVIERIKIVKSEEEKMNGV